MTWTKRNGNKTKNPNWRQDNVSPAQIWKLKQLGYREDLCLGMTKGEASDIITAEVFGNKKQYDNVAPPVCTVKPGDTDCPFGPTGKRFPYLAEEDWQASLKRIAEQENSRAKDKVK